MMLRHTWSRAKFRIVWVAAAVVLYVPFIVLVDHH